MSSLQDFMLRVVPWPGPGSPGHINLHWKLAAEGKKAFWGGRPYETVENMISMVGWCLLHQATIKDLYFCLSLQSEKGRSSKGQPTAKRLAQNALALKAIWLDVDVKDPPKGYATLDEAMDEVQRFVEASDLPPPSALVASGGGLHVYWISDKPLVPDEWCRYAEGLKQAAVKYGLRCDAGVTTDAARILRVPGTLNWKTDPPKPVTLMGMRPDDYDFSVALSKLAVEVTALVKLDAPFDLSKFPKRPIPPGGIESLSEGIERAELPPLPFEPIVRQCGFYREALLTGGKDHSQGMWNLAVLGTTFMENGHVVAHEVGNKHPGYTRESTDDLWARKLKERTDRGLGWPSCRAIHAEGSSRCATCPFFGKIKSPLHLALNTEKPKALEIPEKMFDVKAAEEIFLPPGYVIDPNTGFINWVEEKENKDGETIRKLHQLFTCKLSYPWTEKKDGVGDIIHFVTTTDMHHTADVVLPIFKLKSTTEMLDELYRQRVKPYTPNLTKIGYFFMAWLTELQKRVEAQQSRPFGWYVGEDGKRHGFIYNNILMKDDNTEQPAGYGDARLSQYYKPKGSIEPWFTAFKTITAQNRPELEIIVAASFAAPLLVTTGEYSGTISAHSSRSGAFKSTSVKIGLAVWGHPKMSKDTLKVTSKSIINKMGIIGNLPVYWDEIKDVSMQKQLADVVHTSTEGVEGGRLKADLSQNVKGDWQTLLITCSNLSLVDYIMSQQKTTAAGVYRVFEFEVPPPDPNAPGFIKSFDASRITQELEHNFGHIGMQYARVLASIPADIDKMTYDTMVAWDQRIKAQPGERFWVATCACILAGARIANQLGCDFHIEAMENCLEQAYLKLRERLVGAVMEGGTQDNTQEILTGWFRDATPGSVWTQTCHMGNGKPKIITVLNHPSPNYNKPVMVQWAVGSGVCMFSRQEFNKYLVENNYPQHAVMEGLKKHFGAQVKKARLCAGTGYSLTQEHLVIIPIPDKTHPLWEMLHAHSNGEEQEKAA